MTALRALDVLSALVIDDGRTWADAASPVQWRDARAFIDGPAPFHYWTRARGYSKTGDAAALALALMVAEAPPGARLYWLAADAEQGGLALDSIRGYAARTPLLTGAVEVQSRRAIIPATGVALDVLPADAPSAWGLRPWAIFTDERAQWATTAAPERLWEAVSSAVAKSPHCRMLVATTAGDPSHPARAILDHASTSALWRVSETPGPPPWMDAGRLAEQRARLPESVYRQLFENEWTAVSGSFLDPAQVAAAFTHAGPAVQPNPTHAYVGGLDLGTTNDAAVFCVGHAEGREFHLDHMMRWQGTRAQPVSLEEVTAHVAVIDERFRMRRLLVDPWQAELVVERLGRFHGVKADKYHFGTASKMHLANVVLAAVREGTLRLYPFPGLREELTALRLVPLAGGAFGFDHRRGGHDDMCVALALAMAAALDVPSGRATSVSRLDYPGAEAGTVVHRGDLVLRGAHYRDLSPSEMAARTLQDLAGLARAADRRGRW